MLHMINLSQNRTLFFLHLFLKCLCANEKRNAREGEGKKKRKKRWMVNEFVLDSQSSSIMFFVLFILRFFRCTSR